MVGASANTDLKVYCVCCVSSEPNMLLYFCVYTYIYIRLSPILLSQANSGSSLSQIEISNIYIYS